MPLQLLFDATGTCSPDPPPSGPSPLFFLISFPVHLRVEAQCPITISSTPSYVLYDTGQANLFLSASFIPVPSKPISVESVTPQTRGLFLSTPQSSPQMGLGRCPATSHPAAASLNLHHSPQHLRSSVLDLSGTSSSHLAEKGDAILYLLPAMHACANTHTEAHMHTHLQKYTCRHMGTTHFFVFVFSETRLLIEAQVCLELTT